MTGRRRARVGAVLALLAGLVYLAFRTFTRLDHLNGQLIVALWLLLTGLVLGRLGVLWVRPVGGYLTPTTLALLSVLCFSLAGPAWAWAYLESVGASFEDVASGEYDPCSFAFARESCRAHEGARPERPGVTWTFRLADLLAGAGLLAGGAALALRLRKARARSS